MGSESRKRQRQVKIRLDDTEFNILSKKAEELDISVASYLRTIAIDAEPPKVNKSDIMILREEIKELKRRNEKLYGMALVRGLQIVEFGPYKRTIESMENRLADLLR